MRMGRPKLLIPLGSGTVFEATLACHLASRVRSICAVVPGWVPGFANVAERHECERVKFLRIDKPAPMSESLKSGWGWVTANLKPDAVMISLADKPLVSAETIDMIIANYTASGREICVPVYRGTWGHPVIMSSSLGREVMALEGDRGAGEILAARRDRLAEVPVATDTVVFDVDASDDVRALRARLGASGRH